MVDTVTIGARHVNICDDVNELASIAALHFCQLARIATEKRGLFTVALSGGSTPVILYKRLVNPEIQMLIDWTKVHFFLSDERCVPPDSSESNFHTAKINLFDHIAIPKSNLHPMKFQDSDPELAATVYENEIREFFCADNSLDTIPSFDLILLGMGSDGHCASLFPNTAALNETKQLVKANYVEAMKTHRITFTYPLINNAANVNFLVAGNDKAEMLAQVLESEQNTYPAQLVMPSQGKLEWFVDELASNKLFAVFNRK